jgi:hypothetical protein
LAIKAMCDSLPHNEAEEVRIHALPLYRVHDVVMSEFLAEDALEAMSVTDVLSFGASMSVYWSGA